MIEWCPYGRGRVGWREKNQSMTHCKEWVYLSEVAGHELAGLEYVGLSGNAISRIVFVF